MIDRHLDEVWIRFLPLHVPGDCLNDYCWRQGSTEERKNDQGERISYEWERGVGSNLRRAGRKIYSGRNRERARIAQPFMLI